jgi:hypothetical protein
MTVFYPPHQQTAKYVRAKADAPLRLVFSTAQGAHTPIFHRRGVRLAISAALSLTVLGSSYHGSGILYPLVAAAWAAQITGNLMLSNVRAKRIMQCIVGYIVSRFANLQLMFSFSSPS